ncbi:MAG: hypothetical protein MJD61_03760 [Proteobacteria bacterium]|nr:hypothetical protein [Pseudomonadota bacterium]
MRSGSGLAGDWARCIGGITDDYGTSVAVGPDGSVYLGAGVGKLSDSDRMVALHCWGLTLEQAGALSAGGMLFNTNADEDPLLVKYGPDGTVQWVRSAMGTGGEGEVRSVAVNPIDGSVVIVGMFVGQANFGPPAQLMSHYLDLFVAKYRDTGALDWVRTATVEPDAGLEASARGFGVAIDKGTGNIVVTGDFQGRLSIAAPPGALSVTAQGTRDLFVAGFSADGRILWLDEAGGPMDHSGGRDATVEPDGSYIVLGELAGGAAEHFTDGFGGDIVVPDYGGPGRNTDVVLAHYGFDGRVLWATHAGYPGEQTRAGGVSHDSIGNVYVAGWFRACAFFPRLAVLPGALPPPPPFDPSSPVPPPCIETLTDAAIQSASNTAYDQFLAKYDAAGNLLWVKAIGLAGDDRAYSVEVFDDPARNLAVGGPFLYLGGSLGSPLPRTQAHEDSIAQYDLNGVLRWTRTASSDEDSNLEDLAVDPNDGSAVASGDFSGTMLFPNGVTLQSASPEIYTYDILLWKVPALPP